MPASRRKSRHIRALFTPSEMRKCEYLAITEGYDIPAYWLRALALKEIEGMEEG